MLAPVNGEFGDHEGVHDGSEKGEGAEDEWEGLANKYEQFEKKVKEYLDDQLDNRTREFPAVNAPTQMKEEQRESTKSPIHHIQQVADIAWRPGQ